MTGFITFDWPSATQGTVVSGINDASQIVGTFYDALNTPHGFVYLGLVGENLDYPAVGTQTTYAYGINNAITVVGTYEDAVAITAKLAGIKGEPSIVKERTRGLSLFERVFGQAKIPDFLGLNNELLNRPVMQYRMPYGN